MILYWRLLKESFGFAVNALRNNKLRTALSLLGVTIGIFSIIAVLTAVDSLDRKIKDDLSSLDKNTIYLTSVSFGPTDIPQWKYEQFPKVDFDEYQYLKSSVSHVDYFCFQMFTNREAIKFEDRTVSDVNVVPVTNEFVDIQRLELANGRFFNEAESNSGVPVAVLGYEISKGLFDGFDPMGKTIRIYGQRFQVIGTLKKKGGGGFDDGGDDSSAFIPVNFLRKLYGDNSEMTLPVIVIKPEKGTDMEALKSDLAQKLRNKRGMKSEQGNNFFINVLSGLTDMIDNILGILNKAGIFISFFSLLVGGFGIANIMFVSVKERTNLIGIQKSLGAKNKFILFQFLFEAIILSVFGGIIGILMVWLISILLTNLLDFQFVLSIFNVIVGASVSIVIGLISGILPAISASQLDPVEAIRTGM